MRLNKTFASLTYGKLGLGLDLFGFTPQHLANNFNLVQTECIVDSYTFFLNFTYILLYNYFT